MGINEGPGSLKSKKREVEGKKRVMGRERSVMGFSPAVPAGDPRKKMGV